MPDDSPRSQPKPLRNKAFKTKILENGNYFVQPNALIDAWLNGIISDYCYKLITILLRHSEDFQVKDSYLMPRFGNFRPNLKKAKEEAMMRNMIRIEKVRVGRSFVIHFVVLDPEFWILSTVENSTVENSPVENSPVEISTGIRRLSSKKKNEFNNNNVCKKNAHTHWTCDYSPQSIVDALAGHGVIKRNKNGFVPNIKTWNRITESELAGLNQGELEWFIGWAAEELRGQFLKLEKGNLEKLRAACFAAEKTLEYEEQQDIEESYEVEYNQKPLDDMPF